MGKKLGLEGLFKISEPKYFKKGEYICNEGDPGEEMYIILQGKAGVYINAVAQNELEIAQIGIGEFFGEMAIFENQVRSATCIAEEDTTCIAINKGNLAEFIASCPEITEKLMAGLSERIRGLNQQLYKNSAEAHITEDIAFVIPSWHQDCSYEDRTAARYIRKVKICCPVCGESFLANQVYLNQELLYRVLPNQRKIYEDAEPLWHFVRSCPGCGYSNYFTQFLKLPNTSKEMIHKVLTAEKKGGLTKKSSFEKLTEGYYRAIHFNQSLNGEDTLLLANLWLYLGWIYEDAGQEAMQKYCHEKSLEYFGITYHEKQDLFYNEYAINQCVMVMAELHLEKAEYENAREYYHHLVKCNNKRLAQQAYDRIHELRKRSKK